MRLHLMVDRMFAISSSHRQTLWPMFDRSLAWIVTESIFRARASLLGTHCEVLFSVQRYFTLSFLLCPLKTKNRTAGL